MFAGCGSRHGVMSDRGGSIGRAVDEIRERIRMKDRCGGRGLDITVDHAASMSAHNVRYVRVELKYNMQKPM
jgi:hypothetical protein